MSIDARPSRRPSRRSGRGSLVPDWAAARALAGLRVCAWIAAASCGDDSTASSPDSGSPELDLGEPEPTDARAADLGPPEDGGSPAPGPERFLDPARYDCRARGPFEPPSRPYSPGCHRTLSCDVPLVLTDRAGTRLAPENTLAAARAAILLGVDIIGVDVRLTSDGALMALHDAEVDRTTDGSGSIASMTIAEVKDLAIVADPGDPEGDWSCERVPTLDELFAITRGRIVVGLHAPSDTTPDLDALLAHYVVDNDLGDDAFVYCYDPGRCNAVRTAQPFVPVVARAYFGFRLGTGDLALTPAPLAIEVEATDEASAILPGIRALGAKSFVVAFLAADAPATLVGDYDGYDRLLADGVGGLLTREPHLLLRALGRLEE
ncbi:MAG: glycerophosphodiester phosphodiesterase family protein [Deltaproteobacteria bacterium]|nr:glycerophosphodiester phosphodiesterase family protein [Deltaproteobacteria bacterium]